MCKHLCVFHLKLEDGVVVGILILVAQCSRFHQTDRVDERGDARTSRKGDVIASGLPSRSGRLDFLNGHVRTTIEFEAYLEQLKVDRSRSRAVKVV